MSYLALYREWRPRTFDEVVEQKHAVFALRQSVISGQIGHAYLFSGTRGTGKTTLAKIFSRAINCLRPQAGNPCNECAICRGILDGSLLDVVEMDAASNNSVDNIRRICDEVIFMPTQARYKVYIVDEVHMLSSGAFNALLKTLEEPPAHAVFILATTEPHRIPATILSRCQRFDFRRIPAEQISQRLREIARTDGIAIDDSGLETIATFADGAMRDAISLLDQARSSCQGPISRDDILTLAGIAQDEFLLQIASAVSQQQTGTVLTLIDQLVMSGRDLARFLIDLAQFYRNLLVCQVTPHPEKLIQATGESLTAMRQLSAAIAYADLMAMIKGLSALLSELRWASDTRTLLEVGLIRLMNESTGAAEIRQAASPSARTAVQAPAGQQRLASSAVATPPARMAAAPGPSATVAAPRAAVPTAAAGSAAPLSSSTTDTDAMASKPAVSAEPAPAAVTASPLLSSAVPAFAPAASAAPAAAAASESSSSAEERVPGPVSSGIQLEPRSSPEPDPDWTSPPFVDEDIPPPADEDLPPPPTPPLSAPTPARQSTGRAGRQSRRHDTASTIAASAGPAMPSVGTMTGAQAISQSAATIPPATGPVRPAHLPAGEKVPAPVPAAGNNQTSESPANSGATDASAIWQRLLSLLADTGHMTLYLFGRTAVTSLCGQMLQVIFAPHEQIHCQELQQPAAQKIIRDGLRQLTGADYQLAVQVAEDPQAAAAACSLPPEDEWIQKLRQTADRFGIPFQVEHQPD